MPTPPDSIPRSLHDIWYAGREAGIAECALERPVCRVHREPKRASYFCVECLNSGENHVMLMRGSPLLAPFVPHGSNFIYTNEHGDKFQLIVTGDRVVPFVIEPVAGQ
jgi:hypothetical protein